MINFVLRKYVPKFPLQDMIFLSVPTGLPSARKWLILPYGKIFKPVHFLNVDEMFAFMVANDFHLQRQIDPFDEEIVAELEFKPNDN